MQYNNDHSSYYCKAMGINRFGLLVEIIFCAFEGE